MVLLKLHMKISLKCILFINSYFEIEEIWDQQTNLLNDSRREYLFFDRLRLPLSLVI